MLARKLLVPLIVACGPAPTRTEPVLSLPAAPSSAAPIEPPKWGEREYHLAVGLWELTGKLTDGRGTFRIAYHDGSTRSAALTLERTISCTLRDGRAVIAVHIVGEDPMHPFGEAWYGFYTGSPPKVLGALVTNDDLVCTNLHRFVLVAGSCERDVTIDDAVTVSRQARCAGFDENGE